MRNSRNRRLLAVVMLVLVSLLLAFASVRGKGFRLRDQGGDDPSVTNSHFGW